MAGFLSTLIFFGFLAAGFHFQWFSWTQILNFCLGFIGFTGLVAILSRPWDLYFEARNLNLKQAEKALAGQTVSSGDIHYVQKLVPRLLFLCLGLHLLCAGLAYATSVYTGGVLGYWFCGLFLLSTVFRPIGAFYQHQKRRLLELADRCEVPEFRRQEVLDRLSSLEQLIQSLEQDLASQREEQNHKLAKLGKGIEEVSTQQVSDSRKFNETVHRVLGEFEKSVAKVSEDKELLQGIRALVHLIKNTP